MKEGRGGRKVSGAKKKVVVKVLAAGISVPGEGQKYLCHLASGGRGVGGMGGQRWP